jgi:hypothetical protein
MVRFRNSECKGSRGGLASLLGVQTGEGQESVIQRDPIPRELSPEPGKDAGLVRSIRGRNLPKEFPYCPERWVRLSQFRFCKVDLNVIQVSVQILHLGHGIPIFVRLLPAIMAD